MSDAPKIEWPPEAREAVATAIRLSHSRSSGCLASAALAALAPFVAQIKAAALRRGAEAMREKACARCEAHLLFYDETAQDTDANASQRFMADRMAAACADLDKDIRSLPIPEDKP